MAGSVKPEPAQAGRARSLISRVIDVALWAAVIGVIALAVFPRQNPNIGHAASDFELPMVGGTQSQRKLLGDLERPVLIEAFASWCGACQRNSGLLSDLEPAKQQGKLDIVAVSIDDSAAKALQAKRSWPIPVDVLHDESKNFARAYGVDVLPTYILVGKDGLVKRVTSGNPGATDIRAWLSEGEE